MRQQLLDLRAEMVLHHIDWYLIPTTDFHGSEYVAPYFQCRKFLSGFTGSAGTLLVGLDEAYLWTDGRYFLQAADQLSGSGIALMKMGQPEVPTISSFLEEQKKTNPGMNLGFDGRVISRKEGQAFEALQIPLSSSADLVDAVWKNRPALKPTEIYELPLSVTGMTYADKCSAVRQEMQKQGSDALLLTTLEEIAWLFNLRGNDIENTPVFYAFAVITLEEVVLCVHKKMLPESFCESSGVALRNYEDIYEVLHSLHPDTKLWVDASNANYALWQVLPSSVRDTVLDAPTPIALMKAIKNDTEISSTLHAHEKDGVAMVQFLHWIKTRDFSQEPLTEIGAADYLEACRRAQDGFKDLSFTTISGYNDHGAIIHYAPTPESDAPLSNEGFLLVDSGGHYEDGTTDITRTIALGPLSDKMKHHYTAVLKAHIALARAAFNAGTTGKDLDAIARKPLLAEGLNFNHGTGHGVGHILSVHEGPQTISPRAGSVAFVPGMITSNEPGVYLEGEFGIRLENEILCVAVDKIDRDSAAADSAADAGTATNDSAADVGTADTVGAKTNLQFRTITYCPFDRDAIQMEMLTPEEIDWVNAYHRMVKDTLLPYLDANDAAWLEEVCQPLEG